MVIGDNYSQFLSFVVVLLKSLWMLNLQILNHCSQGKYKVRFLWASGHIFVNQSTKNIVICLQLFNDTVRNPVVPPLICRGYIWRPAVDAKSCGQYQPLFRFFFSVYIQTYLWQNLWLLFGISELQHHCSCTLGP